MDMTDDVLHPIGDLARRTGLTVKAIRYYADHGIVAPTERSPSGYRLYDAEAAARLDLVRTLRDLGLDLPTIRTVLDRERTLPEVAATHAAALAVQLRALRLRHAVLSAIARRESTPQETELLRTLATLTEDERARLIDDFLSSAFTGVDPAFVGITRSMTPELPVDATTAQLDAWMELALLARDPEFRALMAGMAEQFAADRERTVGVRRGAVATARDLAEPALAAGTDPTSARGSAVITAIAATYASMCGLQDGVDLRRRLLIRLETANDPRRERYLDLLSTINGWPPPESMAPALDWAIRALRAHPGVVSALIS